MKKRGFTLIELMIVLAIIAILAVVIVPKSSIFKKNAKTAGVTTNMNTVRAYLETKTGDNALAPDKLQAAMAKNFTGDDAITNPKKTGSTNITLIDSTITTPSKTTSVVIVSSKPTQDAIETAADNYKGTVVIFVGDIDKTAAKKNCYIVYGVDLDGNLLGSEYTIEK